MFGQSFRRLVVVLLTTVTIFGIGAVAAAPASAATPAHVSGAVALTPAQTELAAMPQSVEGGATTAASTYCSWPRCTVYLTKAETRNWAYNGYIAQPPLGGVFASLWWVLATTHRWFAIQYANMGRCVAFQISAYPWDTQGMFSYAC